MSEGSGSGTEVGGLTGPTLAALRARCRLLLASTADWPDASLDAWIGDAIRFYSNEFPRLIRHPLTLVTGTQSYALPAGCVGVVLVEYPAGEASAAAGGTRDGRQRGVSGGRCGVCGARRGGRRNERERGDLR